MRFRSWLMVLVGLIACLPVSADAEDAFTLRMRTRGVGEEGTLWAGGEAKFAVRSSQASESGRKVAKEGRGTPRVQFVEAEWEPNETALIICDMWDLHTSRNATLRTGELAPRIDELAKEVRSRGGTVIHCPSGCMEYYEGHPARLAAKEAPSAENAPEEIGSWCHEIPGEEDLVYPIDQEQGGMDDDPAKQEAWADHLESIGRKRKGPWIKQHPKIAIEAGDYITDRGQEVWNILEAKNIDQVLFTGVHTNMCVLGRPFGLRRLAANGKKVVLVRDLTDTMYNPRRRPYVSHFTGTDLIVAYIERAVCPTVTSDQIAGGKRFRFKNDDRPHLAIVCAESEYKTAESLKTFAKRHLGRHFRVSYIHAAPDDKNRLVGLEQVTNADVMLLSVRRRALPDEQLKVIRAFLKAGKPIVGIRTASHAFSLRGKEPPKGHAAWESFDADIWGGNYHNHHGNGPTTDISVAEGASGHPILSHIEVKGWTTPASLYRVRPLKKSTNPLLRGKIPEKPAEPVAWTNTTIYDGRAFYTSLGHTEGFKNGSVGRLLFNSLFWVMERDIPKEMPDAKAEASLEEISKASSESFDVSDGLVWEPVLAEPRIGQPVSLKFDERGRLWVMEYLQYPYPAGLKMLSKDEYWRAVYDRVSKPPPHGPEGRSRISIHEDSNGDGHFDRHSVFLDDLSIATSFARGRGGVFVLSPPYLLFYPDKNRDDVPDGDPEVLLEGFGLEDTHSVANSLRWGPDGWLYACQGSTVSGSVKRYGSDEEPVATMGQLVWRYHPERKEYEVFAQGGGNAFGLEINGKGNVYSGHNGGNTHGFHYISGGYYQKSFAKHGPLSNPYTFGFYEPMKHGDLPRFTHDLVVFEGTGLPERYRGKLFAIDPLQQRITLAEISRRGSTFQTRDIEQVVQAEEGSRFRPVEITTGPDGAIYVADFYEEEISHRSHFKGTISKQTGRVFRLRGANNHAPEPFNLAKKSTDTLIALLDHSNRWQRQTALRLLYDRRDRSVVDRLREAVLTSDHGSGVAHPLDHLWALFGLGGLDDGAIVKFLGHSDPFVRSWTIRLACQEGDLSPRVREAIVARVAKEEDMRVHVQIACSARRVSTETSLAMMRALLMNDLEADDPFLPLACWWAIEAECGEHAGAVVDLFSEAAIQEQPLVRDFLLERLMRRLASGSRSHLALAARLLDASDEQTARNALLPGFEKALRGREAVSLPRELVAALAKLGDLPLTLRLRQGDAEAFQTAISRIGNAERKAEERIELARILGQSARPEARPVLLELFQTGERSALRRAALAALAAYPDGRIAESLIAALPKRSGGEQVAILSVLVSRAAWAEMLLEEIETGAVEPGTVPVDLSRRILAHGDAAMSRRAAALWPVLADGSEAEAREPETLEELIAAKSGDPYKGKRLFASACGRCHTLFGEGGDVGPDLTSDPRNDLSRLVGSIVDPSAEIREGFEGYSAVTTDGRVITGLLRDRDEHVVILREADGRNVMIPRDELLELVRQPKSLMPDGVLKSLSDQDVRDLFAYLRSSQPLNE